MPHAVERSAVTSQLIVQLQAMTPRFAVGDNSTPDQNYGWGGSPNAAGSNFYPWVSLSPLPGRGDSQTLDTLGGMGEWKLGYSIYVAGVNRAQSESLADRVRALFTNTIRNLECAGQVSNWRIQGMKCTSIGANNRIGDATPYYFAQTDTYEAWVTEG